MARPRKFDFAGTARSPPSSWLFDPQFQQSPALRPAEIDNKEDDPCPLQIARRPDERKCYE